MMTLRNEWQSEATAIHKRSRFTTTTTKKKIGLSSSLDISEFEQKGLSEAEQERKHPTGLS